ncbi:MAG: GNAT family N-acetyltransferase [Bdellovibrionales bacterium]
MTVLACKIFTSESDVAALAGDWRALHARFGRSAFSNYDVFAIWWRTVGRNYGRRSLHVVAGYIDGKLAGVLPLTVVRRQGMRVLQAAGYKGYNYCDMVAENADHAAEIWDAAASSRRYDFASIRDVYPDSLCYRALSFFARRRDMTEALFLRIEWKTNEEWLGTLSSKTNRELRRRNRRLGEKGVVTYHVYREGPIPSAVIDQMIRHKIEWCRAHNEGGLFVQPGVYDYFRELVEILAAQGRIVLSWLQCGDEAIAYNLCIDYHGVLHGYVLGYNPVWAGYSPGMLLVTRFIGWAIENGYQGLDLRQGGSEYKSRFTNVTRACAEFTFSRSFKGRMLESSFMGLRAAARALRLREFKGGDANVRESA